MAWKSGSIFDFDPRRASSGGPARLLGEACDQLFHEQPLLLHDALHAGRRRRGRANKQCPDEAGHPIPGLYAADRAAPGICSNNYVSRLSIGDYFFSGRRAGRNASLVNRHVEQQEALL